MNWCRDEVALSGEAEMLADARLVKKERAGRIADLIDHETHAQKVPRALQSGTLRLLFGAVAMIVARLALGIPEDGPALAGIDRANREILPIGFGPHLARPFFRCHSQ